MEKIVIQPNIDNDLKYRDGLLEDDKNKKKQVPTGEITEKTENPIPLEYFTE